MTNEEIKKKLIEIFSIILNISESKINMDSSPNNTKEWDSLNHIKIIIEIENTFNIEILPEESLDIMTVGKAFNVIESKI